MLNKRHATLLLVIMFSFFNMQFPWNPFANSKLRGTVKMTHFAHAVLPVNLAFLMYSSLCMFDFWIDMSNLLPKAMPGMRLHVRRRFCVGSGWEPGGGIMAVAVDFSYLPWLTTRATSSDSRLGTSTLIQRLVACFAFLEQAKHAPTT